MFKKIKIFNNTFNFNWSLDGTKFWVQFFKTPAINDVKISQIYSSSGQSISELQHDVCWVKWTARGREIVDLALHPIQIEWNITETHYLKYDLASANLELRDQYNNSIMQVAHVIDVQWSPCGQFLFIFYTQAHNDNTYGQLYSVTGQKLGKSILRAEYLQWGKGHIYAISTEYDRYKTWPKFLHDLLNFCYRSNNSYILKWLDWYNKTQLYNYAGQAVGRAWRNNLSISFNNLDNSYFVNFLNDTHQLYNAEHNPITNILPGVAEWSPCGTKYFLLLNQNKIKNGCEPIYLAQLYDQTGKLIGAPINLVSAIYWNKLGTRFIVYFNNYSCQVYNAQVEPVSDHILDVKDIFWSSTSEAFVLRRFYPGEPEKGEFLELYSDVT